MNYCKTDISANQRCGDGSTNSLDIDETAYESLTGTGYNDTVSVPAVLVVLGGGLWDGG